MHTGSHETGNVRHIYPESGAYLIGDLTEALEVDDAGICRSTGNDHLRLALQGDPLHLIIVDIALCIDAVGNDLVETAGEVDR